jgi:DNA-binding response OmpR family regulator
MRVLIVEGNPNLGSIWSRHLERHGCNVDLSTTQSDAIELLRDEPVDVIILDLILKEGSAFAVADFASYRRPTAKVIFVSDSTFFSDGSIFQHIPNACAMIPSEVTPEDLGTIVEHYGTH